MLHVETDKAGGCGGGCLLTCGCVNTVYVYVCVPGIVNIYNVT